MPCINTLCTTTCDGRSRAPKILIGTDQRPCIAKVPHAMGSLGIFVINTDADVLQMNDFLNSTNNPDIVVTEFIDIDRNLACHFFVHPDGTVTWFGYSENLKVSVNAERTQRTSPPSYASPVMGRTSPPRYTEVAEAAPATVKWSSDSTFYKGKQQEMEALLAPYGLDVAAGLLEEGFWGFCGIDVLFDKAGKGYVVDVNPRVMGSMQRCSLLRSWTSRLASSGRARSGATRAALWSCARRRRCGTKRTRRGDGWAGGVVQRARGEREVHAAEHCCLRQHRRGC